MAILRLIEGLNDEVKELKRLMPTELEKVSLEAHVDLCGERYKQLHDKLDRIDQRVSQMHEEIAASNAKQNKTLITIGGTVIAGLLSTIVAVLIALPNIYK